MICFHTKIFNVLDTVFKFISVFLVVLSMVLGLTACSPTEETAQNTEKSDQSTNPALGSSTPDIEGVTKGYSGELGGLKEEEQKKVIVYSARKEHLIKDIFKAFSMETGIEVDYVTDAAQPLLARLKAEGERTPADIFLAVDVGNLWQASNMGVLRPVESVKLRESIPKHLRSSKNEWFGLSQRARTLVYSTERVDPATLSSYEALAGPDFLKKLCLRTSKKVYNQSLVATLIAGLGESKAQGIVEGWVTNLATDVFSNDTAVIQAIAAGQCDVGIVNTYYLGAKLQEKPDLPVALFWANQDSRGTHVNISGAGIVKHAKNPEAALQLLEWLVSPVTQHAFSEANLEYPVINGVALNPLVKSWGEFKADDINVEMAGKYQAAAVRLMDKAGYR